MHDAKRQEYSSSARRRFGEGHIERGAENNRHIIGGNCAGDDYVIHDVSLGPCRGDLKWNSETRVREGVQHRHTVLNKAEFNEKHVVLACRRPRTSKTEPRIVIVRRNGNSVNAEWRRRNPPAPVAS